MSTTVVLVVVVYFAITLGIGFWVARKEKKATEDYFLAGRKLPWYAIAMSMTGSNIGTEHFIGMIGTAYAFGLAPATFEWGNFIPYSILCWIFLPYFFRKKLYTVPEFLERRYGPSTRSIFAILTMLHMILGYLIPALYAGGRIIYEMGTNRPMESFNLGFMGCIVVISAVTAAYCIYGGLLSVVWTDVMQVTVLVVGGLILLFIGVDKAGGISEVIEKNLAADASRLSLIHSPSHPVSPWPGVATFWLTLSLWYVGANQFYIQRCLGAKSEWDAKMGVIGAAYIKFSLPFIIVFPGLIAFAYFGPGLSEDAVYVKMINDFLPPLGQGILLAALMAALMSTVSSVLNSVATIWTMDIHKRFLHKAASEPEMVRVGRLATLVCITIGTVAAPFVLYWRGGLFIYIQDMAAFFAPPITVIFLAAFLWRRAHSKSATFTLVFGIIIGVILKIVAETAGENGIAQLKPLLNRAAVNWILSLVVMIAVTVLIRKRDGESYDSDIIWNRKWARLPGAERHLNLGLRSLMFWWIVMISISAALFVIFG